MRIAWLAVLAIVALAAFVLVRLNDHDLSGRDARPFAFSVGPDRLSGTMWRPEGPPRATVMLVHGDGSQDRISQGGYAPLVNALLDAGIGVASWDKPGVGGSSGEWLDQSIEDRAEEVRAAGRALAAMDATRPIGALGFSQAGWVLPKLERGEADFVVLIGAAVSWERQGRYYGVQRRRLGNPAEPPDEGRRAAFVERNRGSDATDDLAAFDLPLLALWGASDLNVDAVANARDYDRLVAHRHPANRVVIVANATHGLLKAGPYNYQLVEHWPWWATLRFALEGRHAYAPDAIDRIVGWIGDRTD